MPPLLKYRMILHMLSFQCHTNNLQTFIPGVGDIVLEKPDHGGVIQNLTTKVVEMGWRMLISVKGEEEKIKYQGYPIPGLKAGLLQVLQPNLPLKFLIG